MATLSVSPTSATVGAVVAVTGSGFTPGEKVALRDGGAAFGIFFADGSGNLACNIMAPNYYPRGVRRIIATGIASGVSTGADLTISS